MFATIPEMFAGVPPDAIPTILSSGAYDFCNVAVHDAAIAPPE